MTLLRDSQRPPTRAVSDAATEPSLVPAVARYALYLVFVAVALSSLTLFADSIRTASFREGGVVENLQLGLLAVNGLILGLGAWRFECCRGVLLFMSCLATFGAIRELDFLFDQWNRKITWTGPAWIVVILGLAGLWRHRRRFIDQLRWILGCPAVGVLWTAMAVVLFGELIGHKQFLRSVLGEHYLPAHKRVVEELFEVFGYFLVLIGAIEVLVRAAAHPRPTPRSLP